MSGCGIDSADLTRSYSTIDSCRDLWSCLEEADAFRLPRGEPRESHMRLKDGLYYGVALLLVIATVPIYWYIIGHARSDVAREEAMAHQPPPKPVVEPPPDFTRETCWTKRVRGTCAYLSEAEEALASGKAKCLGGLVMVVRKQGETTVVEEWTRRTQCYY